MAENSFEIKYIFIFYRRFDGHFPPGRSLLPRRNIEDKRPRRKTISKAAVAKYFWGFSAAVAVFKSGDEIAAIRRSCCNFCYRCRFPSELIINWCRSTRRKLKSSRVLLQRWSGDRKNKDDGVFFFAMDSLDEKIISKVERVNFILGRWDSDSSIVVQKSFLRILLGKLRNYLTITVHFKISKE